MDWPRCEHCGERMCCDGKGNYECVCDEALKGRQASLEYLSDPAGFSCWGNSSVYLPLNDTRIDLAWGSWYVVLPIPVQVGDKITLDYENHIVTITRCGEVILTMVPS